MKSHPEPVFTPELVTAPVKASDLHAGLVVQNPDTDEPDMVVARRYETDTNTVEVTFLSDGRSVRGSADQVFEPASVKSLEGTLFRVPAPNGLGDRSAHNSADYNGWSEPDEVSASEVAGMLDEIRSRDVVDRAHQHLLLQDETVDSRTEQKSSGIGAEDPPF